MNLIDQLSSSHWNHLGATLLHTFWQGAVISGLLFVHLKIVPAHRPQLRYAGALAALAALLIGSFLTWAFLDYASPRSSTPNSTASEQIVWDHNEQSSRHEATSFEATEPSASKGTAQGFLLLLWIVGVDIMIIRLGLSLASLKDLRDRAVPATQSELAQRFESLLQRTQSSSKRLRLLLAEQLEGPVAFGFLRPTIILPTSLAINTPPALLEAILAHELAHIRRHDYVVNLGQLLVETLLFFNPAVWWISHQIRNEREACCDADAIKIIGSETNYATALADYATEQRLSMAALPFGEERRPGSLIERVRRILVPNYRPTLKLPLPAVTVFLLVSSIVLFALHQGSRFAVAIGAELLTPEERIAKIQAIQESHPTTDPHVQYDRQLANRPESRVLIEGTIRTADGSELVTEGLITTADSERPGYSSSHSVSSNRQQFSAKVRPGQIYMSAYSPHYAPALLGPFRGEIAGSITNIVIEMKLGFTGTLRIVDENGQAIRGARIKGRYEFPCHAPIPEAISNDDGVITIPNALAHPMQLKLRAAGYEEDFQTVTVTPASNETWQLNRAAPATVIVSNDEAEPIKGATAQLMSIQGFRNMSFGEGSQGLYATSDSQGKLTFTELRTDSSYWFLVRAPGYGKDVIRNVTAGEINRKFILRAPRSINGTITGDLSLLDKRTRWIGGKRTRLPSIQYKNPFNIQGYSDSSAKVAIVQIDDDSARFTIEDLWPGTATLIAGPVTTSHELTSPVTTVAIELTQEAIEENTVEPEHPKLADRRLRIRLNTPEGHPKASGSLYANFSIKQPGGGFDYQEVILEVKDGLVDYSVTVGSRVRIEPDHFTGYWFPATNHSDIPEGTEPFEINLTCYPAGAIYGTIEEANGDAAHGVMISLVEVKRAPARPNSSLDVDIKNSTSSSDVTKSYTATPLPLGGTYMIVAHRNSTYALSKPLGITEENPVLSANLVMQTGITVKGRVLKPNGEPAAHTRYEHRFDAHANHGFSTSDKYTDRLGRFVFKNVVPGLPGTYGIRFQNNPGFQRAEVAYTPDGTDLQIQLKAGHRIHGTIVDAKTGWPIPGVEVYALPHPYSPERTGHIEADRETDSQGRFEFTTLDDGDYSLGNRGGRFSNNAKIIVNHERADVGTHSIELYKWSTLEPTAPKAH